MAYAAAISLMNTIERLINSTDPKLVESVYLELKSLCSTLKRLDGGSSKRSIDRSVIKTDWSMVSALDGKNYKSVDWSLISAMFENSNRSINRSAINALDGEIREAVWKLEGVLESYAFYHSKLSDKVVFQFYGLFQSLLPSESLRYNGGRPHAKQQIDYFLKTVRKFEKEYIVELCSSLPREEEEDDADDDDVLPIDDFGGKKSTMTIGLSNQIKQIRNELLDRQPGFHTVSLFGMAGIGKTHLAREIYQNPVIVQDFDFTAWLSIGPNNEMENILADIVAQIERKPRNLYIREDRFTLAMLLQKCLHGRRYLIVLDDIWSAEVCDYLIGWLPTDGNCRLLLTTRLEEVAKSHSGRIFKMRFLNDEESWDLLWRNVFDDKSFPPQLEKVGRKIAKKCEGLPLLILAVANILRGLEKTEEYWKKVADKKTSTFTDAYDKIEKVLYSSYEYLPQHLKACFLYMGVFPESCEIRVSKLINLWVVEYFFEPWVQHVEDVAMECMMELVSKSVAIVCKQSSKCRIQASRLHSAYCYLCVKEARRIEFFHVLKNLGDGSKDVVERQRRLSVQNNILFGIKEVYDSVAAASTARSLLCTGDDHEYPVPICFNLMLLKVLDALSTRFYEFPKEVVKLLQLRYLALTHNGKVPSSISNLQELQCLAVRQHHNVKLVEHSTSLPREIWDMQELRHLHIMGRKLPDPRHEERLPNLSSLYMNAHSCTKAVFRSIPKLKKLVVKIELQPGAAETISCFEHIWLIHGLESLKCVVVNPRLRSQVLVPRYHLYNLPRGLKELSLNGLGYSWKYVSAIGSLSYLQVLKLRCCSFRGVEWETESEEFPSLESLLLEDIDLVQWTALDDSCFPSLRRLIIRHCYKLKEIPQRIGAIPTLETMEVVDCSPSAVSSAMRIRERRASSVEVVIKSSWNF